MVLRKDLHTLIAAVHVECNAFVLFQQHSNNVTPIEHADFVSMTVDRIFAEHMTAAARTPGRRSASFGNPLQLSGRHFIECRLLFQDCA